MSKIKVTFKVQEGELYVFRYKSELAKKGKIHVYDQAPMCLVLSENVILKNGKKRKDLFLGINLHWIPPRKRQKFLNILQQYYKAIKPNMKTRLKIKLYRNLIKVDPMLRQFGLQAVRMYYYKNITRFMPIPREMWNVVLKIKQFRSRFAYKYKRYKH